MVGLAIVAANRLIDVIIMKCINESACLKLLGSGVVDILIQLRRNLKIIQVGGALDGTVNEYNRLNLEDEQQDASNVLNVLKESAFQVFSELLHAFHFLHAYRTGKQ